MKVKITTAHITSRGAVAPGTVVDLPESLALEYLNSKMAVAHRDDTRQTATAKQVKETATS